MFWNKKNHRSILFRWWTVLRYSFGKRHRHITLKARMALSYALLFFTSCAIIFWLMIHLISAMLNRADEAGIRWIAMEIELTYIMGSRFDRSGEIRPGKDYPVVDRAILEQQFPGLQICYVYRTVVYDESGDPHTKEVYNTAYTCYQGDFYEMRVRKNEPVYSRKINLNTHLARLRRYFMQQLYARGQDNLFIGIFNVDGSSFLTTDMLSEWIVDPEAKPLSADPDEKLRLARLKASDDFGFLNFTLPDGRKLVIGRSVKHLEQVRTQYTLLFFGVLTLVTLAGICVGWLISLRFIRGIKRTTLAMNRISSGDYSYRIDAVADGDREISELMRTFNAMNARTEVLLRDLKMVTDDVAHDLRTPLTRLSGTVELLLRDRDLNENVRSACVSAAEEIARMRELIDVMMEISRTNSNPGEIRKTAVDLGRMLRDFCEIMQPAIEERGLELRCRLPDDALLVMADKTKIQRVISNLLENALKFTEHGWIEVTAQRLPECVRIQIADTGCGIRVDDQKRVFERFFRCDASRNLSGNGLGLSLVQAVIKAHGWQIALVSVPDVGTTLTITVPESDLRVPETMV